jgi:hypothetical protein
MIDPKTISHYFADDSCRWPIGETIRQGFGHSLRRWSTFGYYEDGTTMSNKRNKLSMHLIASGAVRRRLRAILAYASGICSKCNFTDNFGCAKSDLGLPFGGE